MALLATTSELVYGSPSPRSRAAGQSNKIELVRRSRAVKGDSWFDSERETLRSKYNSPNAFKPSKKRSSGTNLFVAIFIDNPPLFSVTCLDWSTKMPIRVTTDLWLSEHHQLATMSFWIRDPREPRYLLFQLQDLIWIIHSDLWIADSFCRTGCSGVPTFNAGQSTSFINKTTSFSIQYGSGSARGSLGQDIIQMAGFTVSNQIFGVCDSVSTGLLVNPVSGLLGLAFKTIASSRATPFWETLVTNGAWDSPLMAFHLTRYLDDPSAQVLEPGGSFTMGTSRRDFSVNLTDFMYLDLQERWMRPYTPAPSIT